jgi:glycosyltransferase involved in cell wall biosynthesis
MKKPRLSICLATYNRAEHISETLESMIPQLTDEVEIVVVDGASTDATHEVVAGYCSICNRIKYKRLAAKGGVDQDFCKAVELAEGEYCWLFPDDDLFKPGAIRTVLNETAKGYSLIVVNAEVANKDFSKLLQARRLPIEENEIYSESSLQRLFHRVIPYISFIGCVVINRDLWLKREKERYFNTEFIHVGVIFQAPLPAPALVIAEPLISIRFGNAQWSQRAFEIWMIKWPNVLRSFAHISRNVRMTFENPPFSARLRQILTLRATGAYSLKEFNNWFTSRTSGVFWRLAAFTIALTPAFLLNFILLSLLNLRKIDSKMTIYTLENNKNNIFFRHDDEKSRFRELRTSNYSQQRIRDRFDA